MKKENFIKIYGQEPHKITPNFVTKSIGTTYDIKDAFVEFADNAYDAKIPNKELTINYDIDSDQHKLFIKDNGTGIDCADNLFTLGATNKENTIDKIGKYGIGVSGAVSCIASQCMYDETEPVEITFKSNYKGTSFEKHALVTNDGCFILGKTTYNTCDESLHGTSIEFDNVHFNNDFIFDINKCFEEIFEIPIHKDFNIIINGYTLGKSSNSRKTFIGDEEITTIKVGNLDVDVKFRFTKSTSKDDRSLDEAGLRIYDKSSGRLLCRLKQAWRWFSKSQPQQNMCGLRCAIYIPSTIESYIKFGVLPAKNGIKYKNYYNEPDFALLAQELRKIYAIATHMNGSNENMSNDITFTFGRYTLNPASAKLHMKEPYIFVADHSILFKHKLSHEEIAELIYDNIMLKQQLDKKNKHNKKLSGNE